MASRKSATVRALLRAAKSAERDCCVVMSTEEWFQRGEKCKDRDRDCVACGIANRIRRMARYAVKTSRAGRGGRRVR